LEFRRVLFRSIPSCCYGCGDYSAPPSGARNTQRGADRTVLGINDRRCVVHVNNGVQSRALVIIPTYNEREMLPETVKRLRAAQPHVDILIVDDGSPDGTGDLADAMAGKDSAIAVMHREEKHGLGPAYIAGFQWALEREYDVVVEMDADASHQPEQLRSEERRVGKECRAEGRV